MINNLEKTFAVTASCNVKNLAEVQHNALQYRSQKYDYPPIDIIEAYLRAARFLDVRGDEVRFSGNVSKLNEIEKDISEYLRNRQYATRAELRMHLEAKGYDKPYLDKSIGNSPIVFIDKTGGRSHYRYSLVGRSAPPRVIDPEQARYNQFSLRLKRIAESGTDEPIESKRRIEQAVLQEWLFNDLDECDCAICGHTFESTALVTAHKKKRSLCAELERLDPYIVMPLCLFGCDYLYENGFIFIENGTITASPHKPARGRALTIVNEVVGRTIDSRWQRGSSTYFAKANKDSRSD